MVPSKRSLAVVTFAVFSLCASAVTGVSAHTPTPRWSKLWANGQSVTYDWGVYGGTYTVPSWLQTVMTNVFEVTWADSQTNNSNGPNFSHSSVEDVVVYFSPDNPIHTISGWLGGADTTTTPKRIWIRSDPTTAGYHNWCHFSVVSGCPDEGRAAIHEVTHIGGGIAHSLSNSWLDSRMHGCNTGSGCSQLTFPFNPTNTWNTRTIGKCDEAAMQLWYDLGNKSGPYADCFDHITNHGTNGLVTDLSVSSTSYEFCAGQAATVSGRLNVHSYSSYEALSGNVLPSRIVEIDKGTTANYASATTTSVSGDNWSHTFAGATNVTFTYTAHYDAPSTEGLDSSPDRSFSITWLSPQVVC